MCVLVQVGCTWRGLLDLYHHHNKNSHSCLSKLVTPSPPKRCYSICLTFLVSLAVPPSHLSELFSSFSTPPAFQSVTSVPPTQPASSLLTVPLSSTPWRSPSPHDSADPVCLLKDCSITDANKDDLWALVDMLMSFQDFKKGTLYNIGMTWAKQLVAVTSLFKEGVKCIVTPQPSVPVTKADIQNAVIDIKNLLTCYAPCQSYPGPGFRSGQARGSYGRGFSERVTVPTCLSCLGF